MEPDDPNNSRNSRGSDRRRFVSKAVAAGVAWTAPMVVSSVALADAGTQKCRVNISAANIITLSTTVVSAGTESVPRTVAAIANVPATCPCRPGAPAVSIRWNFTGPGGRLTRAGAVYVPSLQALSGTTNQIDISNDADNNDLEVSGIFTVTATVRWRCNGIGATPADACASRSITFRWDATGVNDVIVGTPVQNPIARNIACGT